MSRISESELLRNYLYQQEPRPVEGDRERVLRLSTDSRDRQASSGRAEVRRTDGRSLSSNADQLRVSTDSGYFDHSDRKVLPPRPQYSYRWADGVSHGVTSQREYVVQQRAPETSRSQAETSRSQVLRSSGDGISRPISRERALYLSNHSHQYQTEGERGSVGSVQNERASYTSRGEPRILSVRELEPREVSNTLGEAVYRTTNVYNEGSSTEVQANLKAMLIEAFKRIVLLGMENDRLLDKTLHQESVIAQQEVDLQNLRNQLVEFERYRSEYYKYKSVSESLEININNLIKERNTFLIEIERLHRQYKEQQSTHSTLIITEETSRSKLVLITNENTGLKNKIASLDCELVKSQNLVASLQSQINSLNQSMVEAKKRSQEDAGMRIEIDRLNHEYSELQSRYKKSTSENERLSGESRDLRNQFNSIQSELERLKIESGNRSREREQLIQENQGLQKERSELLRRVEEGQLRYASLEKELLQLKSNFEKANAELRDLRQQFDKLYSEHQRLEAILRERDSAIKKLESDSAGLLRDLKILKETEISLGKENQGLKQEIREMDGILEQFEKEKERLAKEFQSILTINKQLEEKISSQSSIIDDKEKILRQVKLQLENETRARQGLETELDRIKAALANLENLHREKCRENEVVVRERNEIDGTLNRLLKEWQIKEQDYKRNYEVLNERVDSCYTVQRTAEQHSGAKELHSDHRI
jgi:chromosome segregation ATPase